RAGLDDQYFVALLDQLARQKEADLSTTGDDRVHLHSHGRCRFARDLLIERAGADDRRADGLETQLGEGIRTQRVVNPGDDALDAEDVLGNLACHDVAVIALSRSQERVRALDTRPLEDFLVGCVTQDRRAWEVRAEAA